MSSFRKRNVQKPIKGTRTSPQTGQVITSSGNPSMDVIFGGGLPIGSICLIEEDTYVTHAKVLAKYFLAEGLVSSQTVFLGSLDDDPEELLRSLPRPLDKYEMDAEEQNGDDDGGHSGGRAGGGADNDDDEGGESNNKNGLRIAWRYTDLPMLNSEPRTTKIGHHFDLLERMAPELTDFARIWNDSARSETADEDSDEREPLSDQDEVSPLGMPTPMTPMMVVGDNADNNRSSNNNTNNDRDDDDDDDDDDDVAGVDGEDNNDNKTSKNTQKGDSADRTAGGGDGSGSEMLIDGEEGATTTTATATDSPKSSSTSTETSTSTNTASGEGVGLLAGLGASRAVGGGAALAGGQPNGAGLEAGVAAPPPPSFTNGKYKRLLKEIHSLLRQDHHVQAPNQRFKQLCRICITSLASPLWYEENHGKDLLKFLTVLRAIVRGSLAVCFITMPMHLVAKSDPALVPQLRNLVDYAIELESFAGSERETHPAFKMYHGLLHMRKVSAVNALTAYLPETCDLAFKLRQKKFVIEKLHLPPELQEDTEQQSGSSPSAFGCASAAAPLGRVGSISAASLDF